MHFVLSYRLGQPPTPCPVIPTEGAERPNGAYLILPARSRYARLVFFKHFARYDITDCTINPSPVIPTEGIKRPSGAYLTLCENKKLQKCQKIIKKYVKINTASIFGAFFNKFLKPNIKYWQPDFNQVILFSVE